MPEEEDLRTRLQELLEQSRESGEKFFADVGKVVDAARAQVGHQLGQLGLATKEDLARVEQKLDDLADLAREQKGSGSPGKSATDKSDKPKASGKSGKKPAGKKSPAA